MRNFLRDNICRMAAFILIFGIGSVGFAQNPAFEMHMDSGNVFGGDIFVQTAKLNVTQSTEIQGWSLSLCNDDGMLPVGAQLGTDASTVKNGAPPDFETTNLSAEAVMSGVVICFTGCAVLNLVQDFSLLDVNYQVLGDVGDTCDVDFCTSGSPPVSTVLVINGNSVEPITNGASFTILSPNYLTFGQGLGVVGQTANLPLMVSTVRPLDGFQIAGQYDSALMQLTSVQPTGVAATAEFIALSDNLGDGEIAAGLIMALDTSVDIPIGDDMEVLNLQFDVTADLGGAVAPLTTPVSFVTSAGTPPITNKIVDANYNETPNLVDGQIEIVDFNPFVRGDCNSDGGLVNIADGISVLQYLFQGGTAPGCLDSCDLDDNGEISVGDAVWIFSYQFAGGAAPLAPFPNLGIDPTTGDGIGCDGDADDQ
ncbi:MAG: hypothetical protein AAEJ04_07870 [Planctomycetota bacterium]